MKRLESKSPQNRGKKKDYNKKNVHSEPTHAWDKSLEKNMRAEISSTKATGATKTMEKERGCF
jgi:hypothetical protein